MNVYRDSRPARGNPAVHRGEDVNEHIRTFGQFLQDEIPTTAELLRQHYQLGSDEEWVCGGCDADFLTTRWHLDHVAAVIDESWSAALGHKEHRKPTVRVRESKLVLGASRPGHSREIK